jgi:UDP-N-acetylmuramoyl-tripeptide--D-alanyl-D-alanine ligase
MIEKLYSIFLLSSGVSIDSRDDLRNKIFFALPGKNTDGNQFALSAIERGARLSIVTDESLKDQEACFFVEDAVMTLQSLAARYRRDFTFPVLGITGSNGKTTTKELLVSVLSERYKVFGTKGNYNNHLGVPITLLSTPLDSEILVLEMGANSPGDISFLCDIAQPNWALITSIGQAHLEGFGSVEGVISAKFQLFESIDKRGGICFVNANDPAIAKKRNHKESDVLIELGKVTGKSEEIVVETLRPFVSGYLTNRVEKVSFHSHLTGHHNWLNIQNVFAAALYLGVTLEEVARGIEKYFPANSRSQWIRYGQSLILMDAYNSNPSSAQAMLKDFLAIDSIRPKFAIMGGMGELGKDSEQYHCDLAKRLESAEGLSGYFLVGQQFTPCSLGAKGLYFDQGASVPQSMIENFYSQPLLVLVKGSRSIRLEELFVSELIEPFNQTKDKI